MKTAAVVWKHVQDNLYGRRREDVLEMDFDDVIRAVGS